MNYFEHNIEQEPIEKKKSTKSRGKAYTTIWLFNKAYTSKINQEKEPFIKKEYSKNPRAHSYFRYLSDEFICANPDCKNEKVKCIWHTVNNIGYSVEESFSEFYCPKCGKYTFVEYYRDDS